MKNDRTSNKEEEKAKENGDSHTHDDKALSLWNSEGEMFD